MTTQTASRTAPAGPPRRQVEAPRSPASRPYGSSPQIDKKPKPEPKILFQKFFKSVGPRTYAAQLKEAANGNHFLVLTEGKRDEKTNEVKKTRLFVFSEDFKDFFAMVQETAKFVAEHPVSPDVRKRREKFWKKNS